jgi:hypothetical protein
MKKFVIRCRKQSKHGFVDGKWRQAETATGINSHGADWPVASGMRRHKFLFYVI